MAKKEIDVTKTGPQSYRDLQKANEAAYQSAASESMFSNMKAPHGYVQPSDTIYEGGEYSPIYKQSQGVDTYGSSIFDESSVNEEEFNNLGDIRANNQPWYAKIGAGLAKGAILAGTTFLDGTLGLVLGAGTAITEDRWSGLWDNDFSKAMQSFNEWSEQVLPNYYTKAEQEQPWYENIFTANFLGDKFIKNLGFTVGAFYSGGVTAAGLKLTKLPQLIGAIAKSSKAPAIVTSAVGAVTSAVNEGRIEALNNSKDWFELHKAQLDDKLRTRLERIQAEYKANAGKQFIKSGVDGTQLVDPAYLNYQKAIAKERELYNAALGKLNEDRLKMGNVDLLMNIPILTASNIIQFGKMYANGFKTARRTTNIVGRAGETAAGTTKLGAAAAITRGSLSEGTEEISQKAASTIAGKYYETDVNNFYKSKTDPKAAQETLSWAKSFAEGINETVNDASSWEEFFIGSLTGALGMPKFRGIRSESGSLQSPITIEGGAINEWRDYRNKIARENEIANYMNNRVNSPEFKNYYQGLIRHNKYQNDMNQAAEQGDEFNFKNAEHAQLVSDIAMFDNAGRMEDLTTLIDAAFDTSDENLASIVENTTTTLEDGSKVGPFVDNKGNPMYATPEGKQEMIKKLQENHDEMTNTINNYLKIKDELDTKTGQQLSDDQLEELTWMKSQIGNWAERATSMSGEVKSAIGNVIGNLDSFLRFNQQVRDFEGQSHADLTDRYKQADKNVKAIEGAINTLNMVRGQDDSVLAHTLATNPKFVDGLINEINEVDETVLSADEKADITTKLNDIVKLGNASKTYNAKLKEYLENPQKQAEDHARADEQAVQQETKKKSDDLKASLNAAQNLQEFRGTIDAQDDTENRDRVLKELEDGGSEMAKNYRETSQYNNEVRRVLNESDAEPQVKQDAMKLLQDQFSNSENLEQLANPNSIYINNENAFDEDSEGDVELSATRFQEAQYALQNAMSKVNNDNRFKDRFSPEYKKPVEKRGGTVRGDDRTDTGDSGTATTPTVTSSGALPTVELPVGNITAEMVSEENKKANERVETPQRPSRDTSNQFYRPAIPELHIEASKEGDFRPFDIVVGEREKGIDFSGIYGYLRDSGAFRYLNEGNLKAGDELGFMIDPSFNDHTIFIIDKRNGQVVGSLDESDYSVSRYEGLKGLEEKIRREYASRTTTQASTSNINKNEPSTIEERIIIHSSLGGKGVGQVFGYNPNKQGTKNDRAFNFWRTSPADPRTLGRKNSYIEHPDGTSTITYFSDKNNKVFDRNDGLGINIWRKLTPSESKQILDYLWEGKYTTPTDLAHFVDNVMHSDKSSAQPQQRQFKTDYQYDKEMSFYDGQIHGTLDRVENGTAIYVDSKGQPTILLAGKSDHQFIGIFREPNSNRWSIKMENKEGDKTIFRDMMSSVMAQLPLGAEVYERTSISVDGLRVFAQQLNHGFEIGNETYETDINGGDLANIFGLSKEDQEAMEKVHISEKELPKVKEILRPYLEKFGAKNIDKVVYLTNGNTLSVKLPILIKTKQASSTQSKGKFIATPTTRASKIMVGRVPYGNTERSLKDIPNVSSTDRKPVFGIIKNGVLTTNNKIDDSLIIKPVDMSQKEGRLYLLIPNGAGKYSPAAVRVKHFNSKEFNLSDSSVSSSPIGEDIKNAITKLSTATSQDDVSAAMQDLAQDLYMQDVMVTWFNSKAGNGVVISKKVRKPDGTYEKVTINGKEQIKEDKYDVYFSTNNKRVEVGGVEFVDDAIPEELRATEAVSTPKDTNTIYKEILGHLIKFNLPLQVSTRRINESAYNNRLINSNILTSNITEASVRSTWFTTDYFDNEGNLHQAISPASVAPQPKRKIETPVGGTEGAISGTRITSVFSNKPYYVDLKTNTIRDDQGKSVTITNDNRILFDLAWAQDNFGDSANSSMMVDNKVLTPDGKVLDRSKQVYLSGQEAQDVKDTIAGRKKEREDRVAKSKEVISEIYENQKRVDKTRTDGEFYYVLEDDGEYHQYSRVHSRLGSNWIISDKQTSALKSARFNLSKFVDNPTQYENYLKYLENKFKIDLTAYRGKTDAKSRDTIVNIVRDKMFGTNSQRALDAGSAVDSIIRQYFTIRDVSKIVKPSNMSENAFIDLITTLNNVKSNMEFLGERFLADNIVLFQKYSDGTRVAGEVDILSVDKEGNFKIYDVKTSRYSFYDFIDRYGRKVNYFNNPSATQRMSTKDYYTLQLSAYKNLFESQYGVPVTKLAVMPFVLSYDKENVSAVQSEKGIPITYNPAVNVPLVGNVKVDKPVETPATPAQAQTVLPIFETSLEIQNPIEDLTPEHKSTDKDKVGYFEIDGKLHKGYVTPLTTINGVEVYLTKVPNITEGFGRQGEAAHVASNNYYAVFPNGKTFLAIRNNSVQGGYSQVQIEQTISKMLRGNTQRVKDMANEKTILFNPDTVPTVSATPTSNATDTKKTKVERIPSIPKERLSLIRNELTSILNKFYPKEIEGNDFYRKKALKGKRPDFLTDKYGKALTIDTIISNIKSSLAELEKTKVRREEIAKKTKGQLSQIDDLRGVEAAMSVYRKRIAGDLANAFYILNESENPSEDSVVGDTTVETPATINQGNTQTGAAYTVQKEQAINDHDEEFEDELTLRKAKDTTETPVWNQEKELKWLNKVLPQLSEQDRVKVVKGLIKVGKRGTLAWGQFDKGVITLSDIAAEGTAYHEAFHAVFNLLLDNSERQALYDEAKKLYGEKDNLSLEEDMAEGFREYVTTRQNAGLLGKIKNFFRDLWIKVTNWNSIRPHLTAYYQMINRGEYSNRELPVETLSQARARQEEYSKEMQDILAKAPRNSEGKLLVKPGGPVSNLDERQYAQVRTKAFKDWFGDWENDPENASKVVDENGEPLVVYHNTPFEFNGIFDMDHKSRIMPWTSEPFGHVGTQETANTIKGTQFALFLNVKNPLETPDFVHETVSSMLSELYKQGIISREKYSSLRGISNSELRDLMLSLGYDGTKYENKAEKGGTSYSFITPNQIKSATDNVGTFSRTNDDIRYRKVPNSSFESLDTEIQENLLKKGWTAEKFDSISQEERDQAVKCIAF